MIKRIFKYAVPINDKPFRVPPGVVVHVAHGDLTDEVRVWVEHKISSNGGFRTHSDNDTYVQVFGTGHPIPNDAKFLGTAVAPPFVWHVYEVQV